MGQLLRRRARRVVPVLGLALLLPASSLASSAATDFESGFTIGSVNGQDGWRSTGPFDQAVVANGAGAPASFGHRSLRISNAVTSSSFGDQTFAAPLTADAAGEPGASFGAAPVVPLRPYLELSFDVATTGPAYQPGLRIQFAPARNDGSKMSHIAVHDEPGGLGVTFREVQGIVGGSADFVDTEIASGLGRGLPHTIVVRMTFVPGPGNDVVRVLIDGSPAITGTSWEDYYRFDPEVGVESTVRAVQTLLIRAQGTSAPATLGEGFLVDNVSILAGSGLPTSKADCKNGGWKDFDAPRSFKNQGDCIQVVTTGR